MSLYPSLEDMEIDKVLQAQKVAFNQQTSPPPSYQPSAPAAYPSMNSYPTAPSVMDADSSARNGTALYPALTNFLGMELTNEMIRENMPEYMEEKNALVMNATNNSQVVAPLSSYSKAPPSANVTHNIREIILCKDANGKVGLRVQAIDNGIFVSIVVKGSPASMAGLRFGDQILRLNDTYTTGMTVEKFHKMIKACGKNNITLAVRDRPFERTMTVFKDSKGSLGFEFKNGKIITIVKDSSASRNGMLTNHNLLEVNGQTVVAMKDKEIRKIIDESDKVVKVTIIPSFIFEHMVKKLSTSFLRGIMDHSMPEF